jgi:hypothetical protein
MGPRWRIDVHCPEGVTDTAQYMVFLTGEMDGMYRSRHMTMDIFYGLMTCLIHAMEQLPSIRESLRPKAPDDGTAVVTRVAHNSMCRVEVGIARNVDGSFKQVLAIYDADDFRLPMLRAIDDEMDQFVSDCAAAVLAAEDFSKH